MASDDLRWSVEFPSLFSPRYVEYADSDVSFTVDGVRDDLVPRLHLIAVTRPGDVIVCRSIEEWRFLPGGRREPGESLTELAHRELMEEAGARLTGDVRLFASHVADSRQVQPYRAHVPHPRSYWAYAITSAEIVGPPSNPGDGEHVIEVLTLPPAKAADYIEVHDADHADVIRLAVAMGELPAD